MTKREEIIARLAGDLLQDSSGSILCWVRKSWGGKIKESVDAAEMIVEEIESRRPTRDTGYDGRPNPLVPSLGYK